MDKIDLSDYLLGGYYIGSYASRPNNKESYLPEKIVSISDCRGDITHVSWLTLDDEVYSAHLAKQGLPLDKHASAQHWYAMNWNKEISYPDGFYSLNVAREFAASFMALNDKHFMVGIGLHKSFEKDFVTENDRLISRYISDEKLTKWGLNRHEPFGVNRIIRQQISPEPNGTILGFEPVTYLIGFICNYLCTVDQFRMVEELHSYPNEFGLIDDFEIAKIVRSWRGEEPMKIIFLG